MTKINNTALPTAQLAIYAILSLPTIYILVRHGKPGLLGWLYLLIFCVLRITGNAMFLNDPTSTGATVITNIGLSPLLLATLGILHESRASRTQSLNRGLEISFMTFLHILIASAIGLIAAGASALTDPAPNPNSMNLVKVGMIILMTCWLIILITAVVSLQQGVREHQRLTARRSGNAGTVGSREYEDGTVLLYAVLISLLPTGIRVLYSVVAVFSTSTALNPVTGSLALRVCLSVVPEMVVTVLLVAAGLWTRDMRRK